MYAEYGEFAGARGRLAGVLRRRSGSSRRRRFCGASAMRSGLRAEADAFIAREKKTTLAAWQDIWSSTHSDFFANAPIAIVAPPTYKDGLDVLSGRANWDCRSPTRRYRTGPESLPNEDVRRGAARAEPVADDRLRIDQRAHDHRAGEAAGALHPVLVSGRRGAARDRHAVRRLCRRGVAAAVRVRGALRRALRQLADLGGAAARRPQCRRAS